ncbi:hypothetical protein I302_105466 [Kwoniella bestiolae CBS 10118]|uniref:Uncharacterized protein n=1 Tax=Kwoniella bestiolae CBS 10118 TaxID=1296100 RepID=A0A1B9FT69_9TREE|nr:hypothetical protein I302_08748 [Kwoniella bestiolae CBS 10118]OCF21967.1 hypothetical protein I302_08748 [Kwoniella bestiolae CBS 10118]
MSQPSSSRLDPRETYEPSAYQCKSPPTYNCEPVTYLKTSYSNSKAGTAHSKIPKREFKSIREELRLPGYKKILCSHDNQEFEEPYNIVRRSLVTPMSDIPDKFKPPDEANGSLRIDDEYTWDGQLCLHTLKPFRCHSGNCLVWTDKDFTRIVKTDSQGRDQWKMKSNGVTVWDSRLEPRREKSTWRCKRSSRCRRYVRNDLIVNDREDSRLMDLAREFGNFKFKSSLYVYRPLYREARPSKLYSKDFNRKLNPWIAQQRAAIGNEIDGPLSGPQSQSMTDCSSTATWSDSFDLHADAMTPRSDNTVTLSVIEQNLPIEEESREQIYEEIIREIDDYRSMSEECGTGSSYDSHHNDDDDSQDQSWVS